MSMEVGKKLAMFLLLTVAVSERAVADPPPTLAATLQKTRTTVAELLEQMSEVKCTETVSQQKLAENGKPEYAEESRFDYLVMMQGSADDFVLDESRLEEQKPKHARNVPLLLTNGFSTLFLVFHPYYLRSFEFSLLNDASSPGGRVLQLAFRHISGTRTPTALLLREREYPLSLTGTAWVDADTGAVLRINAELENSMEDIGLKALQASVEYAPVRLKGVAQQYWLPANVSVEVETPRQHWRNVHRFADYKVFSVTTEEAPSAPGK